jgi:hypothetical protein
VDNLGHVVDVDDSTTWPEELSAQVNKLADQIRIANNDLSELPCCDLALWEHEEGIRRLLDGYLLRAYHATRLLPHEVDAVHAQGLRILSPELVKGRLATAHQLGYITDVEHHKLLAGKTLTSNRLDQICLFLSTTTIARDADGLHLLLNTWGGEGIYWQHAHSDNPLRDKLRSLGRPIIVVAQLDLTVLPRLRVFPGLANAFVGAALGLADVGGDILYSAPIPAAHIERLIRLDEPATGKRL